MIAILLGPPGAGKGTQARVITEHFRLPAVSTGDMLRAAGRLGTPLGLRAKALMDAGHLVPDDLIVTMVRERIAQPDCARGFLLDGFPRTLPQAEALEEAGVHVDAVVEIAVPDELIVRRMAGRRIHPPTGRSYHVEFNPPRRDGFDDETGDPLVQRDDDREETVRERLAAYHKQTEPLSAFYRARAGEGPDGRKGVRYLRVDGTRDIADVGDAVVAGLRPLVD